MNKEMFREACVLIPLLIITILTIVYLPIIVIAILYIPHLINESELALLPIMGLMGLIGLWLLFIIPEFKNKELKVITFLLTMSGIVSASFLVIGGFREGSNGIFGVIFNWGPLILIVMALVYGRKLFTKN